MVNYRRIWGNSSRIVGLLIIISHKNYLKGLENYQVLLLSNWSILEYMTMKSNHYFANSLLDDSGLPVKNILKQVDALSR